MPSHRLCPTRHTPCPYCGLAWKVLKSGNLFIATVFTLESEHCVESGPAEPSTGVLDIRVFILLMILMQTNRGHRGWTLGWRRIKESFWIWIDLLSNSDLDNFLNLTCILAAFRRYKNTYHKNSNCTELILGVLVYLSCYNKTTIDWVFYNRKSFPRGQKSRSRHWKIQCLVRACSVVRK